MATSLVVTSLDSDSLGPCRDITNVSCQPGQGEYAADDPHRCAQTHHGHDANGVDRDRTQRQPHQGRHSLNGPQCSEVARPRNASAVRICSRPPWAAEELTTGKPARSMNVDPTAIAAGPGGASIAALARPRSVRPSPIMPPASKTRGESASAARATSTPATRPPIACAEARNARSRRAAIQDVDNQWREANAESALTEEAEPDGDENRSQRPEYLSDQPQACSPLVDHPAPRRCPVLGVVYPLGASVRLGWP